MMSSKLCKCCDFTATRHAQKSKFHQTESPLPSLLVQAKSSWHTLTPEVRVTLSVFAHIFSLETSLAFSEAEFLIF